MAEENRQVINKIFFLLTRTFLINSGIKSVRLRSGGGGGKGGGGRIGGSGGWGATQAIALF